MAAFTLSAAQAGHGLLGHPHWHHSDGMCVVCTSRSPTATQMVLSSMRNPKEEQGVTFNHTPDSREDAAIRRARDLPSGASSNNLLAVAVSLEEFHAFWWCSLVQG